MESRGTPHGNGDAMKAALVLLCRIALTGVFLAAALPKIADPLAFAEAVYRYQILPYALVNLVALFLPWMELIAAVALWWPRFRPAAGLSLGVMLAVFTVAIAVNLARGVDMTCGCFSVDKDAERMSGWNLARNAALIGMVLVAAWPASRGRLKKVVVGG